MKLKNVLPQIIYEPLIRFYDNSINPHYKKSYAQEGEDVLIYRMVYGKINNGFYVDVGAHHPKRFSNTYFFYKQGWNGINIEPMPGSKKIFDKFRQRDINLEIPISVEEKELEYYIFNDSALNGFSIDLSFERDKTTPYKIVNTVKLRTQRLDNILDRYLPKGKKIDLISIDVEGLDMEVLKSNNWEKYLPEIILIEDKDFDFKFPEKSMVYNYLSKYNYLLKAKTLNTLIFIFEENRLNI